MDLDFRFLVIINTAFNTNIFRATAIVVALGDWVLLVLEAIANYVIDRCVGFGLCPIHRESAYFPLGTVVRRATHPKSRQRPAHSCSYKIRWHIIEVVPRCICLGKWYLRTIQNV